MGILQDRVAQALDMHLPKRPAKSILMLPLELFVAGVGDEQIRKDCRSVTEAWASLHGETPWVKTLLVTSKVMDAVAPPRIDAWLSALDSSLRAFGRRHGKKAAEDLRNALRDMGPTPLTNRNERHEFADDHGIAHEEMDRLARWVIHIVGTELLGVCISVNDRQLELLKPHFPRVEIQVDDRVCLLDCQRIRRMSRKLRRSGEAKNPFILMGNLAWVIWFHEQSHSTRAARVAPEEEMMAQIEAYRLVSVCRTTKLFPPTRSPTGIEVMKRLARRQRGPYRIILNGRIMSQLGLRG